jgi:hypothetical protein
VATTTLENIGFSVIYRPFDSVPTFPAKVIPRLPSRKSKCRQNRSTQQRTHRYLRVANNSYSTLMPSGVFNVPHELRSAEVGLADECLPAEVGHADAG